MVGQREFLCDQLLEIEAAEHAWHRADGEKLAWFFLKAKSELKTRIEVLHADG